MFFNFVHKQFCGGRGESGESGVEVRISFCLCLVSLKDLRPETLSESRGAIELPRVLFLFSPLAEGISCFIPALKPTLTICVSSQLGMSYSRCFIRFQFLFQTKVPGIASTESE